MNEQEDEQNNEPRREIVSDVGSSIGDGEADQQKSDIPALESSQDVASQEQQPQHRQGDSEEHRAAGDANPYSVYLEPLPPPSFNAPHPSHQHSHAGGAFLQYYETQMRDYAAAYASAAAGAAWAASQIAADLSSHRPPTPLNPHVAPPQGGFPSHAMPMMLPSFLPVSGTPTFAGAPPVPANTGTCNIMDPSRYHQPPSIFPIVAGQHQRQHQRQHRSMVNPAPPVYDDSNYSPSSFHWNRNPNRQQEDFHDGAAASLEPYGHRRRKRQQRMPPSSHQQQQQQQLRDAQASFGRGIQQGEQAYPEKRGRRRRFRHENSSSDHNSESQQQQQYDDRNLYGNSTRRRRLRKMPHAAASSSSDGGRHSSKKKKQRQQLNDDSLLGKRGVSALYEWCGKRRIAPVFSLKPLDEQDSWNNNKTSPANNTGEATASDDSSRGGGGTRRHSGLADFEMIVSVDGIVRGQGRGPSKAAAKEAAARRALHALLPGVLFDEASGILVQLPRTRNPVRSSPAQALEDLAPNLAKQLAIGQTNSNDVVEEPKDPGPRTDSKKRGYRFRSAYPGTSTTSDDEGDDAYYASRGASVCSSLLYGIVQIDDRIPEPPQYSYEISNIPLGDKSSHQLKRKAASFSPPIVAHRASFTCSATLKLLLEDVQKAEDAPDFRLLQAEGIGATKREAKHTASASLLALLFPECDGMVQVKQAAEAARDKYAASKAQKQQESFRERALLDDAKRVRRDDDHEGGSQALPNTDNTLPFPASAAKQFKHGLGTAVHETGSKTDEEEGQKNVALDESSAALQLSREKQLKQRVAAALQKFNEHDEEGRSLSGELTEDDVGRTILRVATAEDIHWINNLFKNESGQNNSTTKTNRSSPLSTLGTIGVTSDGAEVYRPPSMECLRRWSSSSMVLLLCRAIAPHEDPPLGCAVTTLGFSLVKGPILRVCEVSSERHLPRERFLECLQTFAACFDTTLEVTSPTRGSKRNAPAPAPAATATATTMDRSTTPDNIEDEERNTEASATSHAKLSPTLSQSGIMPATRGNSTLYSVRPRSKRASSSAVVLPGALQAVQEEQEEGRCGGDDAEDVNTSGEDPEAATTIHEEEKDDQEDKEEDSSPQKQPALNPSKRSRVE